MTATHIGKSNRDLVGAAAPTLRMFNLTTSNFHNENRSAGSLDNNTYEDGGTAHTSCNFLSKDQTNYSTFNGLPSGKGNIREASHLYSNANAISTANSAAFMLPF